MYVCTVCMYGVTFSSKPTTSTDSMDVVFSVTDFKDTSLVVSTVYMYVCMYVFIFVCMNVCMYGGFSKYSFIKYVCV